MLDVSKILKIELFILFTFTIFSFIAFYYQNQLPDNYIFISSQSSQYGFFTYYVMSLIAGTGYYVGPWIFLPFMVFSLFYMLQFSRRELFLDTINIFSLSMGSLFITYYFFSEILGEGIRQIIENTMSTEMALGLGFVLFIGFFAGAFRGTFRDSLVSGMSFLGISIVFIYKHSYYLNPFRWKKGGESLARQGRYFFKFNILNFLKKGGGVLTQTGEDEKGELIQKPTEKGILGLDQNDNKLKKEITKRTLSIEGKGNNLREEFSGDYNSFVSKLILKSSHPKNPAPDESYFNDIMVRIETKLAEFKIKGQIINILKGPVVDTFELELGIGVKVSKVLNHEADLGLALYGASIRIVYPMSGKVTMGIEVPRDPRGIIYLDESLDSTAFQSSNCKLPLAMGKNSFGEAFVVDLASMPHMLVAGATGVGKSVFINSLLVSLIIKKSPAEMKLILIDPKQLELALYHRLPHLLMPVITKAREAAQALLWACQEMERRYLILKDFGVRNIESFNEKVITATPEILSKIHHHYDNDHNYILPYLVIIVDEFADLMLIKSRQEIENNISRLAAKARASGIHLILATQRPSVDVITGLIKSNFPTRVAFRVTSQQDSRTILTTMGAEKLLGKGDGLFRNGAENYRFHSSFIDETKIEVLTERLSQIPQHFNQEAIDFLEKGADSLAYREIESSDHSDYLGVGEPLNRTDAELFNDAFKVVQETQMASASLLQRRLRIGYNRASILIEQMEAKGIIGPGQGVKKRAVLINPKTLD